MAAMTSLQAAALWSGLSILLLVFLSFRTIFTRRRLAVSFGDGGHAELTAASRAFGNAAEYIPPCLVILVLLALLRFQPVWVHLIGGGMLLGRILHAWGLSRPKQPSFGRMAGMILTQAALVFGAGALIGHAFGAL
ncbi:MAG: MAPEG family protein [Alphaproteobacteria bacterium]|nr:MAPEG family protein [Alphaproteobacteria bacterium]MBU2270554.1 MAPEG family protein [Alphaproteobacteria bacterium]MBU2417150.1 MAPEG family protein [Alphaproteobacteria bacterium]